MTITQHIIDAIAELAPDVSPLARGRIASRVLILVDYVQRHGVENVMLDVEHRVQTAEALADTIRKAAGMWAPRFIDYATGSDKREVERYRAEISRLEGKIEGVFRRVHDRSLRAKPKTSMCECGSVITQERGRSMLCQCGNPRMIPLD